MRYTALMLLIGNCVCVFPMVSEIVSFLNSMHVLTRQCQDIKPEEKVSVMKQISKIFLLVGPDFTRKKDLLHRLSVIKLVLIHYMVEPIKLSMHFSTSYQLIKFCQDNKGK